MIQAFIRAFQTGGLDLTAEEIADTLWLAAYIDTSAPTLLDNMADARNHQSSFPDLPSAPPLADVGETINTTPLAQNRNTAPFSAQTEVHLPPLEPNKRSEAAGIRSLPFRTPAATALPGKLALTRSLRPLLRRVPSRTKMVLDESATVQRIAEVRNSTPILQPGQERWLDLSIVVDEWQTMVIWHQTVTEFIELLQQIGAFRTIQTYGMVTEVEPHTEAINAEQVKLYATYGIGGMGGRVCNQRELIDQGGRRLILVLSDCTAPIWYNGAVGRLLALWGKSNMVALVQMLPTALWESSMLAQAVQVYVSALAPGLTNAELSVELPWYWMHQDKPAGYPVPVVTLEPEALAVWSKLLTGKGNVSTPAIYLPLKPVAIVDHEQEVAQTAITPEDRWQHFQATVSPLARELAGYLSAAPLSMPVMRLVQRVMLPQSHQVHLAEVFRSGLIERVTPYGLIVEPDMICYEFINGMRQLLLTTILVSDTQKVLEKVSEYISRNNDQ
ncbi:hypothetical protein KC957_04405, partial [Candidatus Saccharibacteria bacterium]|nr:hypothetical protein [Candidatus Saccharibacteria bacterium]